MSEGLSFSDFLKGIDYDRLGGNPSELRAHIKYLESKLTSERAKAAKLLEACKTMVRICRSDLETHWGENIGKQIRSAIAEYEKE